MPDEDPRRARLIPGPTALAPLLSHAAARPRRAGTSFGSQATQSGRQAVREPAHRDLSTLRPDTSNRPGPQRLQPSLNQAVTCARVSLRSPRRVIQQASHRRTTVTPTGRACVYSIDTTAAPRPHRRWLRRLTTGWLVRRAHRARPTASSGNSVISALPRTCAIGSAWSADT